MPEARFPIQRAPERLGVVGKTAVRSNLDLRTGEAALAKAIAGFGESVADLGMRYELKEANTQLSEYQRRVREDNNLREIEISKELDPNKHNEIYKRHWDDQQGWLPQNRRASEAAVLWNNQRAPSEMEGILKGQQLRIEDNWKAELFTRQAGLEKQGTSGLSEFESFITRGIVIDANNPAEVGTPLNLSDYNKIMQDARKSAAIGDITNAYGAGDFDFARGLAHASEHLSPTERESMLVTIAVAENRARNIALQGDTEKQSALYKQIDAGEQLTRSDFENAYPDPDEADSHFDEYQDGLRREAQNVVNVQKQGDPVYLANIEAIIDLNPHAITEKSLHDRTLFGIGTSNIERLVDRLRKNKEGVFDIQSKYDQQFSRLFNAEYFGDKDEIETSTTFLDLKRRMAEYIGSQRPDEKMADEFFSKLIVANFKGIRRGGWDERGFRHTYTNFEGEEVEQFFRYGDLRTRRVGKFKIQEYYAGSDDKGNPRWLERRQSQSIP